MGEIIHIIHHITICNEIWLGCYTLPRCLYDPPPLLIGTQWYPVGGWKFYMLGTCCQGTGATGLRSRWRWSVSVDLSFLLLFKSFASFQAFGQLMDISDRSSVSIELVPVWTESRLICKGHYIYLIRSSFHPSSAPWPWPSAGASATSS